MLVQNTSGTQKTQNYYILKTIKLDNKNIVSGWQILMIYKNL